MASLEIPEKYHSGMRTLLEFTDSDVLTVVSALATTPASASTRQLDASVRPSFTASERTAEEIYDALRALRALYGVYATSELPLKEFVSDLIPALQEVAHELFTPARRKKALVKFSKLLGVEKVAIFAKMQNLSSGGEPSFCRARINTDLRPVFIGGEENPRGYMLVHRLQLGFHSDEGDHKDFYVTLDDDDLRGLRTVIESAERKANLLQKNIHNLG